MIQWIRTRLADRPDSEHEQALIRVGFALIIMALLPLMLHGEASTEALRLGLMIAIASLVAAIVLFGHIVLRPGASPGRRLCGMAIDTLGVNGIMLIGGVATAAFYPILLWIVFGHGFRFGRAYLFAAAGSALVQFAAVVALNPEWRELPGLDISLVLALILLPLYVSGLLRRLETALQTAEEASKAKSRFLAVMSHEFRTPLNAIIGMGDVLARSRLDTDQRDTLRTIAGAAQELLRLVNELLDFAKIEARKVAVERVPFRLSEVLAQSRALLSSIAAERGLYLRLRIEPDVPMDLIGGVSALHHILTNLMANAVKFTHEGGVTVTVRRVGGTGPTVRLRFEVKDTGIGIPAEAQARIFESFEQAESGTARQYGGTGLGLSIAHELLAALGGTIDVASARGVGSCFSFELEMELGQSAAAAPIGEGTLFLVGAPSEREALRRGLTGAGPVIVELATAQDLRPRLAAAHGRRAVVVTEPVDDAELSAIAATLDGDGQRDPADLFTMFRPRRACNASVADLDVTDVGSLRSLLAVTFFAGEANPVEARPAQAAIPARVLVADDNATNLRVARRILELAGHEVLTANDGDRAAEIVGAEPVDVVLMDLNMPGLSGIDSLKLMRFVVDAERLPAVVALTADATPDAVRACRDAGFADYLTKPIDSERLLATIARLVAARPESARAHRLRPPSPPAAEVVSEPAVARRAPVRSAATLAADAVVDPRKLDMLRELDSGDGFLEEVLTGFIDDARQTIERIGAAAREARPEAIRDEAHALRSSAAHVGAVALVRTTMRWRGLDDAALVSACRTDLERLDGDLEAIRAAFQRFTEAASAAPR